MFSFSVVDYTGRFLSVLDAKQISSDPFISM